MRRWTAVWMAGAALLAFVGAARAHHDGLLDGAGLDAEAAKNSALRRYMQENGRPDVAEVRSVRDEPPWDDHEVTIYYLDQRKEISFARARILGRASIHQRRYERTLSDGDVATLRGKTGRLAAAAGMASDVNCSGRPAERAECAAGRAEAAVERIDVAAVRAEQAADKTEAIVAKMESQLSHARRKN